MSLTYATRRALLSPGKGVGVATNVLRSPIDNAILLSPINGQQMTTPRSA